MSDRRVEYRTPVPQSSIGEGPGRALRKTASSHTMRYADWSSDEEKGGGARLDASPPDFLLRQSSAMGANQSLNMTVPQGSPRVETGSPDSQRHETVVKHKSVPAEKSHKAKGKQRANTRPLSDDDGADDEDSDSTLTPPSALAALPEPVQIDPQTVYPARACLFIANLNHAADDTTLTAELHRGLSRINNQNVQVFLKIRRDSKNMPFAFAQYTTEQDAAAAVLYKQRYLVCGRGIRIERLKGNSEFIIHRKRGEEITFEQASNTMLAHGKINSIEPLPLSQCQALNVPNAFIVKYMYFDEKRNIRASFAGNVMYKVRIYDEDDATKDVTSNHTLSENQRYLIDQEYQGRSVFFGSLPKTFTEQDLNRLARTVGSVRSVEYHVSQTRPVGRGTGFFGFVEYSSIHQVQNAVTKLHNKEIDGVHIRVHPRRARSRGSSQTDKGTRPEDSQAQAISGSKPAPPPVTAPTTTPGSGSGSGVRKHGEDGYKAMGHRSNVGSVDSDVSNSTRLSSGSSSGGSSYGAYANSPESSEVHHRHAQEEQPRRPQLRRRPALPPINTTTVGGSGSATPPPLTSTFEAGSFQTDTGSSNKRGSGSAKSGSSASPQKSCFPARGKKTPSPQKEVTFASPQAVSPVSDSSSELFSDAHQQPAGTTTIAEKSPFDAPPAEPHPLVSGNAYAAAGYWAAQQMYGNQGWAAAPGTAGPPPPPPLGPPPPGLSMPAPRPADHHPPPPPPPPPPTTNMPSGLPIPGVPTGSSATHTVAYVPSLDKWLPVILPTPTAAGHSTLPPPPPGMDAYDEYRYPRGPPPTYPVVTPPKNPYALSLPKAADGDDKSHGCSSQGSNTGSPTTRK